MHLKNNRAGFTLMELLIVILIIGILAAIAMPQYYKIVEKGRFDEAHNCFLMINASQERYLVKNNTYTAAMADLDSTCVSSRYFDSSAPVLTATPTSYTAALTRSTPTPTPYGAYTVTYTGPAGIISCSQANCTADLLP